MFCHVLCIVTTVHLTYNCLPIPVSSGTWCWAGILQHIRYVVLRDNRCVKLFNMSIAKRWKRPHCFQYPPSLPKGGGTNVSETVWSSACQCATLTWSCWASWFSSPSTIGANLSLLFLSAAIVMAAKILSRLKENREQGAGKHKSQQTLLSPCWQDIYSQFSAQTPCILSSLVCWCGHLLSQSLVTLTNVTAFHLFVCYLVNYCCSVPFWVHRAHF